MSVFQHVINLLLPPSKAEVFTNIVASASVTTVVYPSWWPSDETLSRRLAIAYLGVSILWIIVQIGFKFYQHAKSKTE